MLRRGRLTNCDTQFACLKLNLWLHTHTHHWIIVPWKRKSGKKPLESDLSRLFVVYCQLKLPRLLLFDSLNKNEKAKKSCCVTQPPPPSCQLQLLRTLCPTATQHCILAWVRPTELEEECGGKSAKTFQERVLREHWIVRKEWSPQRLAHTNIGKTLL